MRHLLLTGLFGAGLSILSSAQAMAQTTSSMRCGSDLVNIGDLAISVREKCGKPVSEEHIGYTMRGPYGNWNTREREYTIVQLLYGPESGYYKVIILEGGRVARMERLKQ